MATPEHYLMQFGGDFASDPTEIWSNTIRFSNGGGSPGGALTDMTTSQQQAAAVALLAALTAQWADADAIWSVNTRLKFVKFNRIDALNHYANPSTTNAAFASGVGVVSSKATVHPLTAALVATWRTSAARGPASRGRIFVPQPAVNTVATSYRVGTPTPLVIATYFKNFLQAMNTAVSGAGGGATLKASVISSVGAGACRHITNVEVGDFLDYMGSRRNNLKENRFTSAALT